MPQRDPPKLIPLRLEYLSCVREEVGRHSCGDKVCSNWTLFQGTNSYDIALSLSVVCQAETDSDVHANKNSGLLRDSLSQKRHTWAPAAACSAYVLIVSWS